MESLLTTVNLLNLDNRLLTCSVQTQRRFGRFDRNIFR